MSCDKQRYGTAVRRLQISMTDCESKIDRLQEENKRTTRLLRRWMEAMEKYVKNEDF